LRNVSHGPMCGLASSPLSCGLCPVFPVFRPRPYSRILCFATWTTVFRRIPPYYVFPPPSSGATVTALGSSGGSGGSARVRLASVRSRFGRFGGGVRGRRSVAAFLMAPDRRLRPASRSIWVSAREVVLIVPARSVGAMAAMRRAIPTSVRTSEPKPCMASVTALTSIDASLLREPVHDAERELSCSAQSWKV
jgi:hypothetical protein